MLIRDSNFSKNFALINTILACFLPSPFPSSSSSPPPSHFVCLMSLPVKLLSRCALTRGILNHPENFTDYAQSILFTLRVAVARTDADKSAEGGRERGWEGRGSDGARIDRFIYARLSPNDRIRSLCAGTCRREDSQSRSAKRARERVSFKRILVYYVT